MLIGLSNTQVVPTSTTTKLYVGVTTLYPVCSVIGWGVWIRIVCRVIWLEKVRRGSCPGLTDWRRGVDRLGGRYGWVSLKWRPYCGTWSRPGHYSLRVGQHRGGWVVCGRPIRRSGCFSGSGGVGNGATRRDASYTQTVSSGRGNPSFVAMLFWHDMRRNVDLRLPLFRLYRPDFYF